MEYCHHRNQNYCVGPQISKIGGNKAREKEKFKIIIIIVIYTWLNATL